MAFDLKGKTALVTGGGSGIGKAISACLARAGAQVHILELDTDKGNQAVEEIEQQPLSGSLEVHGCDISDHTSVEACINRLAGMGYIDILVNNAGIAHIGNIEDTSPDDLDRL